jgi:uncharacterized protein (DUF1778 family)
MKVQTRKGKLKIQTQFTLKLDKLILGSVVRELTDSDWVQLYRQISKSLEDGRLWPPRRNFDRDETWTIRINPLKTKGVFIRFNELDLSTIKDAAELAKKSFSDFIRSGALKLADEVFDRETVRKQQKREQGKLEQSKKAQERYVT